MRCPNTPSLHIIALPILTFNLYQFTVTFGFFDSLHILQVIIDSQPLTVAVLAALLFGESIGIVGAAGLALGVVGLVLLEVNILVCQ